jgi:lipoprotein-anchoring transpeptidase ErfK/SrfK
MRVYSILAAVAAGLFSVSAVEADTPRGNAMPGGQGQSIAPPVAAASTGSSPTEEPGSTSRGDVSAPAPVAAVAPPQLSSAPKKPRAPTLEVTIDLGRQRMAISYGGRQQSSWAISSGRAGYPTPRGVFRPKWSSKMWYSRKYDNAPMPHAVFFNGGIAVHGTQSLGLLGQPASHGCVRLAPGNAARFYQLVHKHGYANTRIKVIGVPPPSRVARRNPAVSPHGQRLVRMRANPQLQQGGWSAPAAMARPGPRRGANGLVYLPPGSPLRGRASFIHNGVVYVRVR